MSPAKKKSKQMILDFGQKNVGYKHCKDCGMMFNLNDEQDCEIHKSYHRQKDTILKFNGWKSEKVVREYVAEGRCIVIESSIDNKIALKKANDVLKYVDTQLGIQNSIKLTNNLDESLNSIETNHYKYYLFIKDHKIIGFCLAENIAKAHKIQIQKDSHYVSYDQTQTIDAICGISRIWVDSSNRRKGIATKLIDCVRANFIYYKILKKNQIAFSDPTEAGRNLARKYFDNEEFLVYNKTSSNDN
jgi:N-acetyltransferase